MDELMESLQTFIKEKTAINERLVGISFRADLRGSLIRGFEQWLSRERTETSDQMRLFGVPVYFFRDQLDDCRVYDDALRFEAWVRYQTTGAVTRVPADMVTADDVALCLSEEGVSDYLELCPDSLRLVTETLTLNGYCVDDAEMPELLKQVNIALAVQLSKVAIAAIQPTEAVPIAVS